VYWCLEIILALVEAKQISKRRAELTAHKILETNFEMDEKILAEFISKLGRL